jgi:hypothetical protein
MVGGTQRLGSGTRVLGVMAVMLRPWSLAATGSMARNPRWESGMGMIPDPRQIGDGDGSGPPILANRGWGWGWTPDPRRIGDGDGDGPPIVGVCRAAALNG